jgi:hypothetical protein
MSRENREGNGLREEQPSRGASAATVQYTYREETEEEGRSASLGVVAGMVMVVWPRLRF